jgi:hypothetical protein
MSEHAHDGGHHAARCAYLTSVVGLAWGLPEEVPKELVGPVYEMDIHSGSLSAVSGPALRPGTRGRDLVRAIGKCADQFPSAPDTEFVENTALKAGGRSREGDAEG